MACKHSTPKTLCRNLPLGTPGAWAWQRHSASTTLSLATAEAARLDEPRRVEDITPNVNDGAFKLEGDAMSNDPGQPNPFSDNPPPQQPNPYQSPHENGLPQINAGGADGSSYHGQRVKSYLTESILCLICCGGIFAIPAIVYAAQVNAKVNAGDIRGARYSSEQAKKWCIIAVCIGVAINLLVLGLNVAVFEF